jgi:DNA-binding NarL/FixJ family response regulator
MISADSPSRTYIVYRHGLFAQGVRSILEARRTVKIVGMVDDAEKALKAIRALRPDVVIMEEPAGTGEKVCVEPFLTGATAGRVVTLSLDHGFATVYDRRRVTATGPADLVKAIRGVGKSKTPGPDRTHRKASLLFQPESGRDADGGRSGRKSRVGRTRRQGAQIPDKLPRVSRGSGKGR